METIFPASKLKIPMPPGAAPPRKPAADYVKLIKDAPIVTEHDGSRWLDYDWLEAQLAM